MALPFVFPSAWVFMASFSTNTQITMDSLALPDRLYVENYAQAWTGAKFSTFVYNSLAVSGSVTVLIGILATMLGYAVARLDFPGRRLLLLLIMMAIVTPVFSYLEPLTRVVRHLGLANSRTAVILTTTATFLPVPTLLMRSFFLTLPEGSWATAGRGRRRQRVWRLPLYHGAAGAFGRAHRAYFRFPLELERPAASRRLHPGARQIHNRLCHYDTEAGRFPDGPRHHVRRVNHFDRAHDRRLLIAHAPLHRRTDRWRFARLMPGLRIGDA